MDLTRERILVTGGAGFVGSHVVDDLRGRGCMDICVPRSRAWDLVNRQVVKSLFEAYRPTVVIHLAAKVGGIGANQRNPGVFFYENLMMGVNLIEESRLHMVRKFVQVGTVCAYPKFTPVPFREEDLWNGYPEETNAPYGIAKKVLLTMLQAYREQYGLAGIYLLPVNIYGPRDNFDLHTSHVIPAMIRKFALAISSGSSTVSLWGSGNPTREFLHVRDAARAIVLATERYDASWPVNIGSYSEITIRELAGLIAELIGYRGQVRWDEAKPDGQPRRKLNIDLAREAFEFSAEIPLRPGLRETIAWFMDAHSGVALQ